MYGTVVVPLDGTETAECALPQLEHLVRSRVAERVVLVRAIEPAPWIIGEYRAVPQDVAREDAANRAAALQYLEEIAARPTLRGSATPIETSVLFGRAGDVLPRYAKQIKADLILLSTHDHGPLKRWFLGSVTDKIIRGSCIPALVVRGPGCCAPA